MTNLIKKEYFYGSSKGADLTDDRSVGVTVHLPSRGVFTRFLRENPETAMRASVTGHGVNQCH